jgi:hypothetical protein
MSGQSACKGCGLLVSWVEIAATGKRMPINPVADSQAGTVFFFDGKWQVTSRHVHAPAATSLYVSHFATCSKASTFRRGGRR